MKHNNFYLKGELQLLERVFLRLGVAETDEQLQGTSPIQLI